MSSIFRKLFSRLFSAIILLFALSLLYISTIPAGVYWKDAGEFCLAGRFLGIAHPAGSPLYVSLAKLASFLPIKEIALRISLVSVAFGALTILILFETLRYTIEKLTGEKNGGTKVIISLCSSGIGLGFTYWHYSTVPEVYTTALFLLMLAFYLFQRWWNEKQLNYLGGTFLALGLACSVYLPMSIFLPGFCIASILNFRRQPLLLPFIICGFFFVLGLAVFIFLPIRAANSPVFNWGNPDNLARFIAHITAQQYQGGKLTIPVEYFPWRLMQLEKILPRELPFVLLIGGGTGLLITSTLLRHWQLWFIPAFIITANLVFTLRYSEWLPHFFLPTFLMAGFLCATGFTLISLRRTGLRYLLNVLLGINLVLLIVNGLNSGKERKIPLPSKLAAEILEPLPAESILVLENGNSVNICLYEQWIRGRRPDVLILDPYGTYYSQALAKGFRTLKEYWLSWQKKTQSDFRSGLLNHIEQNLNQKKFFGDSIFVINSQLWEKFKLVPVSPFIWEIKHKDTNIEQETLINGIKRLIDFLNDAVKAYNLRQLSRTSQNLEALVAEVNNSAEVYYQSGLKPEAMKIWEKLLLLNRAALSPLLNLARANDEMGKTQEAEKLFTIALKSFPDAEDTHFNAGVFFLRHKRYTEAIRQFKIVLKFNPNNKMAQKYLESLQDKSGN